MGLRSGLAHSQIITLKKITKRVISILVIKKTEGKNYRRKILKLEEKGMVIIQGENIKLSTNGVRLLRKICSEDIKIVKPEKWDQKWHIIAYDIPERMKKERNYLRIKLKELGFSKLQASMWVLPYNCKEEIALFTHSIKISTFIIYLTTDKIPNNNYYILKYNLS